MLRSVSSFSFAHRCGELRHCLDLHVAVLQLPFIILFQQHGADQADDGRSHNVANSVALDQWGDGGPRVGPLPSGDGPWGTEYDLDFVMVDFDLASPKARMTSRRALQSYLTRPVLQSRGELLQTADHKNQVSLKFKFLGEYIS